MTIPTKKNYIFLPIVKKKFFYHLIISIFIIFLGIICMFFLSKMKKEIPKINIQEEYLVVKILTAKPNDYPTNIIGYGIVNPTNSIHLAAETGGKITFLNPNFRIGKLIPTGDILLKIDDLNHTINFCIAKLNVSQCKNYIKKIKIEQKIDISLINNLEKNRILTQHELERTKKLFEKYNIGTIFQTNQSKKAYIMACNLLDKNLKSISLYPSKINEAINNLKAAEVKLMHAKSDFKKCKITAPFNSRIKKTSIEIGDVVSPGKNIAIIVNDNSLEVEAFIDFSDAKKWINFESINLKNITSLVDKIKPVCCEIICEEGNINTIYEGYIDCIKYFDKETKNLCLGIKVKNLIYPNDQNKKSFPLLDGMFCKVNIPGKIMKKVYKIPRRAINSRNEIYILDKNSRLKSVPINILKLEKDFVFINKGLNLLDSVITTPLTNPLEGVLLKVEK